MIILWQTQTHSWTLLRTTQMSCLVTQTGFSSFQPDAHTTIHWLFLQVSHTNFPITVESCVSSGFVHFFLFVSHTHSHISFFIEKRVAFIVKVTIFSPCTEASIVWWCRRSATQFLMWHSFHGHVEAQLHSLSSYCCHIGKPHLAHVLILLTC